MPGLLPRMSHAVEGNVVRHLIEAGLFNSLHIQGWEILLPMSFCSKSCCYFASFLFYPFLLPGLFDTGALSYIAEQKRLLPAEEISVL